MTTVLVSSNDSNRDLTKTLENYGARCVSWPPLNIGTPTDDSQLREAIENLFGYDWLILKNTLAAEYFLRAFLQSRPAEALDTSRVVAVGANTAAKAGEFRIHVDIALERFAPGDIYDAIRSYVGDNDCARLNLLVPSAKLIREAFEEQFEAAGARVDSVAAYRTTSNAHQLTRLKALLAGAAVDYVTFTNADEFDEFAALFDTDDLAPLVAGVSVICLDELTAKFANRFGLSQTLTPSEPSFDGVADLISSVVS